MYKVAVFGLGRFGAAVATRLYDEGAEVLAVDSSLDLVEEYRDQVSAAVAFDATNKANLQAYDVQHMDAAVVAIGDFEASVLATVLCQELGVRMIVAKALSSRQRQVLRAVGAHRVVQPEEEMGLRLAEHLLHASVLDFVELPEGYSLRRLDLPPEWVGKTLAELRLLTNEGLNLVQIVRGGDVGGEAGGGDDGAAPGAGADRIERIPLPHGGTLLREGDRIDVIGSNEVLRQFRRRD